MIKFVQACTIIRIMNLLSLYHYTPGSRDTSHMFIITSLCFFVLWQEAYMDSMATLRSWINGVMSLQWMNSNPGTLYSRLKLLPCWWGSWVIYGYKWLHYVVNDYWWKFVWYIEMNFKIKPLNREKRGMVEEELKKCTVGWMWILV